MRKLLNIVQHIALFGACFGLDLASKFLALSYLACHEFQLGPFLNLHLRVNQGTAWSCFAEFGAGPCPPLVFVILGVLIVFSIYCVSSFRRRGAAFPEMLVLAGGVANLVDRVWHGGVVDFLDVHLGSWHWASFNVADVCIVAGVVLVAKRMLYEDFWAS